jgi:hypothetical protein
VRDEAGSNAQLGDHLTFGDGFGQPAVVEFVLIGVRSGEASNRPIELPSRTQVSGDGKPIT